MSRARALVAWYRENRRDLPWRRAKDPYAIWVSELMLQQTRVSTVIPYYERWMKRFPTVAALARADESDVLRSWEGLGYYARARNLHRGARTIVERHGGRLPRTAAHLRELPGVGPYTAGAIASIAFDEPVPIVDGNVARVLARFFALRGEPTKAPLRDRIWELAASLVPARGAGDFNQALMELGATVCTPREPTCASCPWKRQCAARRENLVEEIPSARRRPRGIAVERVSAVIVQGEKVSVVRRPDGARLWRGLWELPSTEVRAGEEPRRAVRRAVREALGAGVRVGRPIASVKHAVTKYRVTLTAYRCEPGGSTKAKRRVAPQASPFAFDGAPAETRKCSPRELATLAMPIAQRKLVRAWLEGRERS